MEKNIKKNEIESYGNNNNNNISFPSLESHSSNNSINSNGVLSLFKGKKDSNSGASFKSNNTVTLSNYDIDTSSYANNTVDTNTTSLLDDWTATHGRVMNIPEENYENIHTDN